MPVFGLGVYQARRGGETYAAVLEALKQGYRSIDTAAVYGNEEDVGRAIRDSKVPRSEIFVTTKLWNSDHGFERCLAALPASLSRLGLFYVDLYLIHSPVRGLRVETWRAMEVLLAAGKTRAIGVSNYGIHHLKELFAVCKVRPAVNQIEISPFLTREELSGFCRQEGIYVEAYSPLTKGIFVDLLLLSFCHLFLVAFRLISYLSFVLFVQVFACPIRELWRWRGRTHAHRHRY